MLVAVQGCSHGCLSAIYDSIHQYEQVHNCKVDLLLLCGDFQALRNRHDFASLAVPPKFQALGTFHEYYSGKRQAPVLTLVIGGNHEASNYMWELYHGGWLAPNIYYLGASGSVLVDGLRVVGASGIYKDHDYSKGHFETVPYNNSTLRSAYHIRSYDVSKLMQLPYRNHTIFMSHDWPVTIPRHGNTGSLIRRKPFFKQEVETDTLGSPPLLGLMKHIQPDHWFSAHLHVKFAAVYAHSPAGAAPGDKPIAPARVDNPDEIKIDDDDDFDDIPAAGPSQTPLANGSAVKNADEIEISDDEFDDPPISSADAKEALKVDESADLVSAARATEGANAAPNIIGSSTTSGVPPAAMEPEAGPSKGTRVTKFLALDKCGPHREFIQFLDIPTPPSATQLANGDGADGTVPGPRLTFDPEWLAISRAFHPFLSLNYLPTPLPHPDQLQELIAGERTRIEDEGLLVPEPGWNGQEVPPLVWEKGPVDVGRIQRFWPTAPAEGEGGGSPSAWYTNPQTVAWCGMLGLPNRINPAPDSAPPPPGESTAT